ncbi:MAG: phosphoribosylglycinamide formyltransferase [Candidatus Omnitrophota bacterium]|nr:MAG: phosphoribosylglycinamide formyltransferase [Candidatus Omnitrophota bacterium]
MKKFAVFCSGFGSNLQAIINALKVGKIKNAQIGLVVSDCVDAYALVRAIKAKIPILYADPADFKQRDAYDEFLALSLKNRKIKYVVFAGFMRKVGQNFVSCFKNRILNIHPALLPCFKGVNGVSDAFEYGVKVTGVTVHLVDEQLDHGPIISQTALKIRNNDSHETLSQRIHRIEHKMYPKAIELLLSGDLIIKGRKVKIRGQDG